MPKLAIYVPKSDMKQIERWRKKINFSRVFMRALMTEIREREQAEKSSEPDRLTQAVAHYRQQLSEEGSEQLHDRAFEMGFAAVLDCRFSADVLRRISKLSEQDEWAEADWTFLCEMAEGDHQKLLERAEQASLDSSGSTIWETAAMRGYAKGIQQGWQQVCDQLEDEAKVHRR